MKASQNTILITGGSAGIGFAFAELLSKDNKVIITGRDEARLKRAVEKLDGVTGIVSDVSDAADVESLAATLEREHPDLNMVINNAGRAFYYELEAEGADAFGKAGEEMLVNYLSIIRLNEKLLPLLKKQAEAAIVNVSSIVSIVPGMRLPTYAASKAALHSYSVSLRHSLARTSNIKVFEVQPPLVNTDFSEAIGGKENGIPPAVVAEDLYKGLIADTYEIRVGATENIYRLYLASPAQALQTMNPTFFQA